MYGLQTWKELKGGGRTGRAQHQTTTTKTILLVQLRSAAAVRSVFLVRRCSVVVEQAVGFAEPVGNGRQRMQKIVADRPLKEQNNVTNTEKDRMKKSISIEKMIYAYPNRNRKFVHN